MSEIDRLFWEDEEEAERSGNVMESSASIHPEGSRSRNVWLPTCRHWRQEFNLEDGLTVFASAWMDQPDRRTTQKRAGFSGSPDIGFYLDPKWGNSTILTSPGARLPFVRAIKARGLIVIFPWEDWGVPDNATSLRRALKWLLQKVRDGKVVEIGCMGGHGRTGTALACVLVLQGLTAKESIKRVWNTYCDEAIESQRQIEFVSTFGKTRVVPIKSASRNLRM